MRYDTNPLTPLKNLIENNFPTLFIDLDGIFTKVNQKFCDLSGYAPEELIGKSYTLFKYEYIGDPHFLKQDQKGFENEFTLHKLSFLSKHGKSICLDVTALAVRDKDKIITHYILFWANATANEIIEDNFNMTIKHLRTIEHALDKSSVVAITNNKGIITYVNNKFCELSGYSESELVGQTHKIINSSFHPNCFFIDLWETIHKGEIWRGDIKNRAKDGSEYWVQTTIIPFSDEKGIPFQYIAIRTDITDKKKSEALLELALKNDFQLTVKNLQNIVFKYIQGNNNNILFTLIEGKTAEKLGITLDTILNNKLKYPLSNKEIKRFEYLLMNGLKGNDIQFEINYHHFTFLVYLSPIFKNEKVVEVVGTATDISKRKKAELTIEKMAYYDHLTDLPNRRLLKQEVENRIALYQKTSEPFALLFLDIDRFKIINDSMGHSFGDQLLIEFGKKLKSYVRQEDIVTRIGGDEFVILLENSSLIEAEANAARIINNMSKTFMIGDIEMHASPSIGVSLFPNNGDNYDTLITNADLAMYQAKKNGISNYQIFTEDLQLKIKERTSIEMDLRKSIERNELELYYQPQINLKTNKIIGVEALIRWMHPIKGMISPIDFIPIAEETGLIVPIGKWVLEQACTEAQKWLNDGLSPIGLNVNVSFLQFNQSSFVDQVKEILETTGYPAKYLNLEITESMTADQKHCEVILKKLRDIGIGISIDDFGTGYSSLSYLSKFPITHLKIDREFIQELTQSNQAIVKSIISLAKNLNLKVVAEGIETKEYETILQQFGCDEGQGFYYSKPLSMENIKRYLIEGLS